MKWHFNFFRFAVVCAAFVALAGFTACSRRRFRIRLGACFVGDYLFVRGGGAA